MHVQKCRKLCGLGCVTRAHARMLVMQPRPTYFPAYLYRGENKGLFVLLSRTLAGPGRTVKQEQQEISRNHVQTFIFPSVHTH